MSSSAPPLTDGGRPRPRPRRTTTSKQSQQQSKYSSYPLLNLLDLASAGGGGGQSLLFSGSDSFLLLFQHACPLRQRIQATVVSAGGTSLGGRRHSQDEQVVYQMAGVRTPWETAQRNNCGMAFLRIIFQHLCQARHGRVILIQTTGHLVTMLHENDSNDDSWKREFAQHGIVVDCLTRDLFGWEEEEEEEVAQDARFVPCPLAANGAVGWRVLQTALHTALTLMRNNDNDDDDEEEGRMVMFCESWTPLQTLWSCHPLEFLQHWSSWSRCLWILPTHAASWSREEHFAAEDVAHAVCTLQEGDLEIYRRSLSSHSNDPLGVDSKLKSQVQPFELQPSGHLKLLPAIAASTTRNSAPKITTTQPMDTPTNVSSSTTTLASKSSSSVVLKQEEGPSTRASEQQQRPQIYLQDNDPEFDDLDDEDVDDDLDL